MFSPAPPSLGRAVCTTVFAVACILVAFPLHAAQIAEWNFDDGTANDSVGSYDMTVIDGGPAISGGIALFDGDEATPSYLETAGFGGNPTWTVALRIRAATPVDQGNYQGIFSNNTSSSANFSWQIENFGGTYQLRTRVGVFTIGTPTGSFDTIVVRKTGGGDGDVWFNGTQVVSSLGSNPGGLQHFRMGTNRNTSQFYAFEADWARVWDSVEDPTLVPEPNTGAMVALGIIHLAMRRRRERAAR